MTKPAAFSLQPRIFLKYDIGVMVAEKKIDVSQIPGTGPGNRVTKGDVLLYLETMQTVD